MRKKFSVIFIFLAFMFTISCLFGMSLNKGLAYSSNEVNSLKIESKSAYLIDANTKTVILSKNENEKLPIASMCKIMTLLLCFDAINNKEIRLDDYVTVSDNASGMGGSQVFLESGAEYLVGELIKSIVVASANDACVAMAEAISGSEDVFVEKMNKKAQELNMDNTVFANCTGLPKPTQYSCAKDVAIMFSELLKHEDYFKFSKIWTDKVMHPNDRFTEISNTNKLIRFYNGCDSGKTGYTTEAGHCLSASAVKNGMRLISVVISAPDSKTRFAEASAMFNYGFANYVNKIVVDNNKPLDLNVKINGGKKDSIEVVAEESFFLFSKKDQKRGVELDFIPIDKIKAPIHIGDIVGKLNIYENGILIGSINVLSNENVNNKTYFDIINDISTSWGVI